MSDQLKSTRTDIIYEHEAAEYLGIELETMERLAKEGTGPVYCNTKPIRIYLVKDLDDWAAKNPRRLALGRLVAASDHHELETPDPIRMEEILKRILSAGTVKECQLLAESALCGRI